MKLNRGSIGDGTLYLLVLLFVLVSGSVLLVGSLPKVDPPPSGSSVIILSPSAEPTRSQLQLYTFYGATVTPTSSPVSQQMQSCGHTTALTEEPQTLYAYTVGASPASGNELALKVFYADEWPLTLGSGSVSPMTKQPSDHVSPPNVGDTSARDGAGLPYFPSVFLTDTTTNANYTSGDAENGGTPQIPTDVYGSWKPLGTPTDPLSMGNGNGNSIASGADPMPANPNGPSYNGGMGGLGSINIGGSMALDQTAEIIWKISALRYKGQPLQSGHSYRAEVILHDGDRDGDIGEACVAFKAT
jgi:hypothetical protein